MVIQYSIKKGFNIWGWIAVALNSSTVELMELNTMKQNQLFFEAIIHEFLIANKHQLTKQSPVVHWLMKKKNILSTPVDTLWG
jgi:hypothetical protein